MEFEKAMEQAQEVLTMGNIDPAEPWGLWLCDSILTVSDIPSNAACLGLGCSWADIPSCQPFLSAFPYLVIVAPNAIAREKMVEELRPRLPAMCLYVVQDAGFRGCHTMREYIDSYGISEVRGILAGAVELPAYGLLRLADVARRDMSKVPRTLSRIPKLDHAIGGFYAGELSVWTGKRGVGKSTLISQILLESLDQGHTVCGYSGELPADQFRQWTYLQAAEPDHIRYIRDPSIGKQLADVDELTDRQISQWMGDGYWLFDLERNTHHDINAILGQFEYAHMRYNADVFLVDNIMSVDLATGRESDYYRAQSDFVRKLVEFAKRRKAHVHLVVHPRKSSGHGGRVDNDDVSGSGDITNRADNVFYLTRETRVVNGEEIDGPVLKTLKNRDFGSHGGLWLDFDRKSRRFWQYNEETGPNRRYGWDQTGQQITMLPDDDADNPFTHETAKS